MSKRSLDSVSPLAPRTENIIARRTERSHEENQERAYIAASRRADRSLEARVQSAKMASEIHKKRTGKGFKITEEIVMKEEMYEEEEDDFPRHYRTYAAHLTTSSPDMNNRLNAYVSNHITIANIANIAARQQEVDRLFAEQFPHATQIAQSQHALHQHNLHHMPHLHHYHFSGSAYPRERTQSMPDVVPMSPVSGYLQPASYHSFHSPSTRRTSIDGQMSPEGSPVASPGTTAARQMSTPLTTYSPEDGHAAKGHISGVPVDPSLTMSTLPADSAGPSTFTSELSHETKLLVDGDFNDKMVLALYDGELMGSGQYYPEIHQWGGYDMNTSYGQLDSSTMESLVSSQFQVEYLQHPTHTAAAHLGQPTQGSGISTPNACPDWEQWINTDDPLPHHNTALH